MSDIIPDLPRTMVDIETLGTDPGAVILSLGAVRFTVADGIREEFYRSISLESCQDAGLTIDADTLEWWLNHEGEITSVLTGGEPLATVLEDFKTFHYHAEEIWAKSPAFDCVILDHAYDAVDISKPWRYWHQRDCRTLARLSLWPEVEQDGDEHDALDDARFQAECTIEALRRLSEDGDQDD